MTKTKLINLILYIALIGMVMLTQILPNLYVAKKAAPIHFLIALAAGTLLAIGAIVASVFWFLAWKDKRVRASEIALAALVALGALWVSATLYNEWQAVLRMK